LRGGDWDSYSAKLAGLLCNSHLEYLPPRIVAKALSCVDGIVVVLWMSAAQYFFDIEISISILPLLAASLPRVTINSGGAMS
jgi:hypothetical protein